MQFLHLSVVSLLSPLLDCNVDQLGRFVLWEKHCVVGGGLAETIFGKWTETTIEAFLKNFDVAALHRLHQGRLSPVRLNVRVELLRIVVDEQTENLQVPRSARIVESCTTCLILLVEVRLAGYDLLEALWAANTCTKHQWGHLRLRNPHIDWKTGIENF